MLTLSALVTAGIFLVSWVSHGNSQKPATGVALYSIYLKAFIPNNTFFSQESVSSSFGTSLDCYTASTATSVGAWFFPNGDAVPSTYAGQYYLLRNPSRVSLFRTGGGVEGIFSCRIPDENGVEQTLLVGIYSSATIQSSRGPVLLSPVVFQLLTAYSQSPPVFSLTVNSTSSPPTTVVWTRNGLPPSNSTRSLTLTSGVAANYTEALVVTGAGFGGVYQCNASNVAGSSVVSITITMSSVPTNMVVTQLGGGSVLVTWTAPLMVDGYLLQYESNGSMNATLLQGSISQYVVRGLMDKTNYTLRILSYCNSCIPSAWGVVTFVLSDPDPPSNVTATPLDSTSVLVAWQPPKNLTTFMYNYVVHYTPNTPCADIQGGSGPLTSGTYQVITGLQEGIQYVFSVGLKFVNGGEGQWSSDVMATTYSNVPSGPPQNVSVISSPGTTLVVVTWNPPSCLLQNGVIFYYVVQYNSSLPFNVTNQTSLSVYIPHFFTTYAVRVSAANSNGSGPFSSYYPVLVVGVPGSVKSVSVVPNIVSVNISWAPPDEGGGWVSTYEVRSNGQRTFSVPPSTSRWYKLSGLLPSTKYTFEVRAVTAAGGGVWTTINTTTMAIGKVKNVKVINLNTSTVQISWEPVGSSDISFYRVSFSSSSSSSSLVARAQNSVVVTGNVSSTVLGGLLAGEHYLFTVSAVVIVNGTEMVGDGESSALMTGTTSSVLALVLGVVIGVVIGAVCITLVSVLVMYAIRRYRNSGNMDVASHDALELIKPPLHLPLPVFEEHYNQHQVISSKPLIEDNPQDKIAEVGEQVVFHPKVSGNPEPTVAWYHDGSMITPDYSIELDDKGKLTIVSVEQKHAGVYRYTVSNNLGSVQGQVSLFVLGEKGGVETDGTTTFQPQSMESYPVALGDFGQYVADLHLSGNRGFRDQFFRLESGEYGRSVLEGLLPQNKAKNRFLNIIAYDDNRVELKPSKASDDPQSGYINASYVNGYSYPRKYITTQGPLPGTLVDFWRLVLQCHVPSIVMITNLKEGGKTKCERYWPEEGSCEYGPFKVTINNQLTFPDYTVRSLQVSTTTKLHKVTQYHFTSWPDHGVPEYATGLLSFHSRVMKEHKPEKGPLLVHCSAGVGRSGTFITIDIALEQAQTEHVVDIPHIVTTLRSQRMKMVQNEDQYLFVHDAILEALMCGDTQIPATNLAERLHKLSEWNPTYEQTSFEHQFSVLQQLSAKYTDRNCNSALQNADKNRIPKNLPLEKYRVILKGGHPDYINASYVNGYKKKKAYIIAQGPLPHTCRDFWKMVHERDCSVIVMLSGINEKSEEVCTRYWPSSGVEQFGLYAVTQLQETMHEGFLERIFGVSNGAESNFHKVTQFQILNWSPDGLSVNPRAIVNAMNCIINEQRRTGNGPIVVHCSDTVSRSGVFCASMSAIEGCKAEGVVDVFQIVKSLRTQKPNTVATVDQYKFVHELVLTFIETYSNYSNFK